MHLLLAQKGALADTDEAVDLGQSPADIIVVSAADTELAGLASARVSLGSKAPTLRLVNMTALTHPMSIDVWCEATAAKSRLVVVRCLGGESYWPYGLEQIYATCRANGVPLIVLPGDDKPDASLARFNTEDAPAQLRLWDYLVQGGAENARNFLRTAKALIKGGESDAPPARELLKAGLYGADDLGNLRATWTDGAPVIALTFYRALLQAGNTQPIDALIAALRERGMNVLPLFISSLKEPVSQETVRHLFAETVPSVVVNLTSFAVGNGAPTVLDEGGAVVLQAVLAGGGEEAWASSNQGLSSRDLAMNVALPELDGRVLTRAIAFKNAATFDEDVEANIVRHEPVADRVDFTADLAARWAQLRATPVAERRVAIVLANYPNRDGRIGNGVGLDTPAGTVEALLAMRAEGYAVDDVPADGNALVETLLEGPTNSGNDGRLVREILSVDDYEIFFNALPDEIQAKVKKHWGDPKRDPFFRSDIDGFALPLMKLGETFLGVQPARGYNIDPTETYHSPDLVPPHGYLAFYAKLREAHAVVHMGKHGNLEWLPGKALALSRNCFPEAVFGAQPHIYPFIVNDPGEGSQAKRRASAVIIDHLTPPLTRAETYGPLKELEALVDEYYEASGVDPRRLDYLRRQIADLLAETGLGSDAGIEAGDDSDTALEQIDAYLCELKEMQIRDGLHIFGRSPEGDLKTNLLAALVRVPRGLGEGADASLQRAVAEDLLDNFFDPLDCDMGVKWKGPRPDALATVSDEPWRTNGDTVERIELYVADLISGKTAPILESKGVHLVIKGVHSQIECRVAACGSAELEGLLRALDGRFVTPGPSGAPTRGRLDVIPTGRNFYSVDTRSVPTPAAWYLGEKSAELLVRRHLQEHGDYPRALGLSAWGTSNMRTGGDDIAQALALIGAKPVWDHTSRRVTGFEVVPLAKLGRPRIDVTLRISGFFRDAFPAQIDLFDRAVRAVCALDEDEEDNPLAARFRAEKAEEIAAGITEEDAASKAGARIYGSKPGAYGAGLQALMDEGGWHDTADLARAYLTWSGYAYGVGAEGRAEQEGLRKRLSGIDAVVHNQDNREHDLLDSDDYYQFEGGMVAATEHLSGTRPQVWHNDHSHPEKPIIRSLEEEIARVIRARVVNPKWIAGIMRHGYKGAFEMAATVDYTFAFAATTGAVQDHHFDAIFDAYIGDAQVLEFWRENNPNALAETAAKLLEAQDRGLWSPRRNATRNTLSDLAETRRKAVA
jgi:cobaltochelatase CobN